MKPKILIAITVVAVTASTVYLLSAFKPQAKSRPAAEEVSVRIEAMQVKPQQYQVKILSRGLVQAKTESALAAQVSGNVTHVSEAFRLGGRFDKGELLLQIDPRDYQAALKLAESTERKAELALQEEKALAEQAKRDWQRLGQGKEPTALVLREPQLAAAQASLDSARQQVVKAQLDLERTQILAPYSGVVLEQLVDLGHFVNKGTSLGRIANHSELEVVLPVSASFRPYISRAVQNLPVTIISTINDQQQTWPAEIIRQGGEINPQSRQVQLVARILPNPESRWQLLAGDYVTAEIQAKQLNDVYVLPRQALVEDRYVWQLTDGRIFKQEVETLWRSEQDVVIRSGIQTGDWVNTTPLANVVSGTKAQLLGAKSALGNRAKPGSREGKGARSENKPGSRPAAPKRPGGDA